MTFSFYRNQNRQLSEAFMRRLPRRRRTFCGHDKPQLRADSRRHGHR